ncbi:hypothetical protein L1987_12304 [Smallanthus sonchifolius]|uniref:Uncharacterized protein n=1 Tax=Smallanthus sonchifolius TaxID=185202 RepID=A0ACB9JG10_9ASTR|nr:hypothetical protein L1987_12304 [Smallanthus sonchifolius]
MHNVQIVTTGLTFKASCTDGCCNLCVWPDLCFDGGKGSMRPLFLHLSFHWHLLFHFLPPRLDEIGRDRLISMRGEAGRRSKNQ